MAFDTQRNAWPNAAANSAEIDAGLRQHMLRVYNYMAGGLALTGLFALLVASIPALRGLFYTVTPDGALSATLLGWAAIIAPFGLVLMLSFGVNRINARTAQTLFWLYAALMGVSLSNIFLVYTGASITKTFFITAASFLGLSLWGYTTKRSLTAFGSFLIMGLFGVLIAMVVNLFLASSALDFVISVLGVFVFAGLTAYDTQKIKEMYFAADSGEVAGKKAVMGALTLYLDFINLFLMLLRFFGDRR